MSISTYHQIIKFLNQYETIALCTIVKTLGSTPLKAGHKMIVLPNGEIYQTIGGGALEMSVIENALHCIKNNTSLLFEHHLTKDHQMCCGGTVWIFIEVLQQSPTLLIFGAGHIGNNLAQLATQANFNVKLIDNRKQLIEKLSSHSHQIDYIYSPQPDEYLNYFNGIISNTYCVVTTYNHQLDRKILLGAVAYPLKYIGMIGSERKVVLTKKYLSQNSIPESIIQKIDMPIGLNINAITPFEIAISILSKLIQIKNQQTQQLKLSSNSINELKNLEICQ
ncbi:MAG: XdhC/CoxI family protein [Bacteroidia bacterium]